MDHTNLSRNKDMERSKVLLCNDYAFPQRIGTIEVDVSRPGLCFSKFQAPVVQMVDNAIQWMVIYPVDSIIHLLN